MLTYLLLLCNYISISQVKYDYIETYDWSGAWYLLTSTSGYYTNAYVSSNSSAAIYGTGGDASAYEYNWYSLPNVSVNSSKAYVFSFRLASLRITSTAATRGVDASDYIYVQLSKDGGVTYVNEMQIRGLFDSYWTYSATGVISKTSNGSVTTYQPVSGGNQETTGKGFAYVELVISGTSNIAIDIYARANASGEEWWFDNFRLDELSALGDIIDEGTDESDNTSVKKEKQIVKITNMLGQDVNEYETGFIIVLYDDGSIVKIFK